MFNGSIYYVLYLQILHFYLLGQSEPEGFSDVVWMWVYATQTLKHIPISKSHFCQKGARPISKGFSQNIGHFFHIFINFGNPYFEARVQ